VTNASPDRAVLSHRAVYIEPPSHHFASDRLFEVDAVPFAGDQIMAPYAHVREVLGQAGIGVHTADLLPPPGSGTRIAYVSIGNLRNYEAVAVRSDVTPSALIAMECPIADPELYRGLRRASRAFRRILSWSDSESLERFTGGPLRLEPFSWPQSFDRVHQEIWSNVERRFLVIMNGNKLPAINWQSLHRERLRAIEYFERFGEIDLYGREWDQPPHRAGLTHIPYTLRRLERAARGVWDRIRPDPLLEAARRVWRGPTQSKSKVLGGYVFAICFENMVLKGWITEKIFDCFFTGTVPVYWGATDVQERIPPECFIDMRRFDGYADLRAYLRSLTTKDVQRYKDAARSFLESDAFYPFSKQAFAELFLRVVEQDLGNERHVGTMVRREPSLGRNDSA
jgi:hypothetical protein